MARRVMKKLEIAAKDPERYFRRLSGSTEYKLRIGDYRLLSLLLHGERRILIERIGHRATIYDRQT